MPKSYFLYDLCYWTFVAMHELKISTVIYGYIAQRTLNPLQRWEEGQLTRTSCIILVDMQLKGGPEHTVHLDFVERVNSSLNYAELEFYSLSYH